MMRTALWASALAVALKNERKLEREQREAARKRARETGDAD